MHIYKLFMPTKLGTMPMFLSEEEYVQLTQEPPEPLDLMSLLSQDGLEDDVLEEECDCEDRDCENCHTK